ncbi:MAG: NADH-quinone oxidoreductase subunit NuoK [Bdellovibrionaceae bacterium]|nr:NADH-quinone oxidoreductase subunit NuoK [Pseudobdellovibrionaceae bacterium]
MLFDPVSSLQNFFPVFLSAGLFFIGLTGLLIRKNLLVILMSLELMLVAVNLNFLSFANIYGFESAPVYIFFIICIAAAEAGVGLALTVRVYKKFKTVNIENLNLLKE